MKGMPLPFNFEGKVVLDFAVIDSSPAPDSSYFSGESCLLRCDSFGEPTSVLDSRIRSGPTSSSTLSSSLGGGGGGGGGAASTGTAGVAAVSDRNPSPKWQQDSTTATSYGGGADSEPVPAPPSLATGVSAVGISEKCAMEDWEHVLSESAAASPAQEQSIFRWMMGDAEDTAMGNLNKALHIGGGGGGSVASEFEFGGGYGVMDPAFAGDHLGPNFISNFSNINRSEKSDSISNIIYSSPASNNLAAIALHHQPTFDSSAEMKPSILSHQAQPTHNPSFFSPFSYTQQGQSAFIPPPAKRPNSGGGLGPSPRGHILYHQPGPKHSSSGGDELQTQAIIDHVYKAAELLQIGNSVLAQGILARLNHHLSPIGKPFNRAAFYCKEALQLLLGNNNMNNHLSVANSSPFSLIFKIGAYKSFSEISPVIEFSNFTCNQALLEALEGFDRIHIVDFDIGYGGQWASFMQELALRSGGAPLLKITALASPSTHDQLELSLTRENLVYFANEINIGFEFEVANIESLNSGSWPLPFENEAVAVNLPVGCLTNYHLPVPLVLRFVKQLSPRIVVSVDGGCDRTDLPFANHIIHALHSYSNLLESLDAVNVNMDALQKIERFLVQPRIEKIVVGRFHSPEKSQHWRTLFLSSGFSPIAFSNFTESQAECVVQRTHVRGFQVEKRQSSLVLCWQRKELISASVWRC